MEASDPVDPHGWVFGGTIANLISTRELSDLSVAEIQEALKGLAGLSAL